ncbi:PD-(D/E)XK nuclease family transposase [Mediterraneibacter agrestimuris]|uniref:PD-(D/E)XK nuclease family transposase n=1 Tax=Mediterraneibacter agrestimuris TaxID=2941333 RepID=UPI002041B0EA|nr:PD-(D/E)XK nuclease family transposase [Mediterraneibacter agrestimuris]
MELRKQKGKQVGKLTVTEQIDQKHQEDLQRLRGFRLLDDDFLTKCFEGDTASIELVLQIVLEKPDLKVLDVRTQVFVENLLNRSVRLDILATDSTGAKLNVEVQRSDKGAGRKRARYNSSMMDANLLKKGEDFDKLPETWVIFITENDVMGKGLPLYPIERCFLGTGERFEDGSHILYVNGAYRGDTPIGKLMHDFSCTDAADMYYGTLADRVRFFKESKEGIEIMCRAMEDMRNQTLKEGAINSAKRMLADGILTLEKVAEYAGLPLDEVKKLKAERTA